MDRRYGGDPQAPPRPPKSLPRVHRPRAPEPLIMNESLQQQSINTNQQLQTQQHQHQQHQRQHLLQQSPPLPPQLPRAPTTAPLVSLQTSSSFARRRPPPQALTIPTISSFSLNLHNNTINNTNNNNNTIEPPLTPVTLAAPRPENERLANEYVDTPFRTPKTLSRSGGGGGGIGNSGGGRGGGGGGSFHLPRSTTVDDRTTTTTAIIVTSTTTSSSTKPIVPQNSASTTTIAATPLATSTSTTTTTRAPTPTAALRSAIRPSALPVTAITKQPISFTKDLPSAALHEDVDIHPSNGEALNSVVCPQCKRCRCEECQRPRQLPSRWICDNSCLCSAETIIDYTTCLCCVKALFYHCSKDHEMERDGDSISCADDPCSCLPHKRSQRWAWLGALSIPLPCLWCYWPMRGCVALCAKCYARHSRHGCRCPQIKLSSSGGGSSGGIGVGGIGGGGVGSGIGRTISRTCDLTPEKRLLDSSPEY